MTLDEKTLAAYQSTSTFFPCWVHGNLMNSGDGVQQKRNDGDGANLHIDGSERGCNEDADRQGRGEVERSGKLEQFPCLIKVTLVLVIGETKPTQYLTGPAFAVSLDK